MERNSVIFVPINKIAYRYLSQIYIIIYFLRKNPQIFLFFRLHSILAVLSDLALEIRNSTLAIRTSNKVVVFVNVFVQQSCPITFNPCHRHIPATPSLTHIRPILRFKDGARLQHLDSVPYPLRHLHTILPFTWA